MITLTAMQPVKGPFKVYQTVPGYYRRYASPNGETPARRDEALFQFHANADRAARSILGKLHGLALKYQTTRRVSNVPRALHPQWSVKPVERRGAARRALIERFLNGAAHGNLNGI